MYGIGDRELDDPDWRNLEHRARNLDYTPYEIGTLHYQWERRQEDLRRDREWYDEQLEKKRAARAGAKSAPRRRRGPLKILLMILFSPVLIPLWIVWAIVKGVLTLVGKLVRFVLALAAVLLFLALVLVALAALVSR